MAGKRCATELPLSLCALLSVLFLKAVLLGMVAHWPVTCQEASAGIRGTAGTAGFRGCWACAQAPVLNKQFTTDLPPLPNPQTLNKKLILIWKKY